MLTRALIVLLLVLNIGVAAWWLTRPVVEAPSVDEPPSGIARLQLLSEAPRGAAAAGPAPAAGATSAAQAIPAAERCFAFGPYADAQSLAAARAALQPRSLRLRTRETTPAPARGWRVSLPPQADRAAAQAMAQRIADAGFQDYFVMTKGTDANGIALGRYGSEAMARQREAALRAAGFPAQVQPLGAAAMQAWIDVAVAQTFDAAATRRATAAPGVQPVDCARLR